MFISQKAKFVTIQIIALSIITGTGRPIIASLAVVSNNLDMV